MIYRAIVLMLLAASAHAQNVQVGSKPSAVFEPTAGGYILRQPGPAHNISVTPQPVTPPSGGIKGVGAFSGGKKFRLNGNEFEMGGKYDMPIPKTGQKAEVTAISKIAQKPLAKSVLKALPLVGNAVALGEVLNAIKDEWDQQMPPSGSPTVVNEQNGTVTRTEATSWWELGGNKYSSAGEACQRYYATSCINPTPEGQPPNPPFPASSINLGNDTYACKCSNQEGLLGQPAKVLGKPQIQNPPDPVLDEVADAMDKETIDELIEAIQSGSKADQFNPELPADAPTTVTGPSSVPGKTTTSKANGKTSTTTSTTNITYNNSTVNITTTNQTTTRDDATNEVTDTKEDSTSNETPDEPKEQKPDEIDICKLNPDILACKKLEEPEQTEIPKRSEEISLQQGGTFSGGGCVPDLVVNVFGQQVTVLSMATPCGWITDYMRPLILLLAAMSAVFIIYPKSD